MKVRGRRLVPAILACAALVLGLAWFAPPTPAAAVDVYTTPGEHTVNGRQWKTVCAPYSGTVERCTTEIWATKTTLVNGQPHRENTWVFNNLTYKSSPRATWEPWNILITPGVHESGGRTWRTQCDTEWTGRGGCRSEILGTVVEQKDGRWQNVEKWIFNNVVHISPLSCPVSQGTLRSITGQPSLVTSTCHRSDDDRNFLAVEYMAGEGLDKMVRETAFFKYNGSSWTWQIRGSNLNSGICQWFRSADAPLDLADTIDYCFSG